jgi:hypothetical protein
MALEMGAGAIVFPISESIEAIVENPYHFAELLS